MELRRILSQIEDFFAENPELAKPTVTGSTSMSASTARSTIPPLSMAPPPGSQVRATLPSRTGREVYAVNGGVVQRAGWQNPADHAAGAGYRFYVREPDGYAYMYGHMDPATVPKEGSRINSGDPIGSCGDPTNGHSSGPHVHLQRWSPQGAIIDPGDASPLRGEQRRGTRFQVKDRWHPHGHQGNDWYYAK